MNVIYETAFGPRAQSGWPHSQIISAVLASPSQYVLQYGLSDRAGQRQLG
jgi:hypothetical protein